MNNCLLIVALYASTAQAYCYYDNFGRRRCTNSLSNAARIIIAVCFSVGAILLLCALAAFRRRQIHRRNMGFIARPAAAAPQGSFVGQPAYNAQPSYGPGQPGYQPYPHQYAAGGYDPTNVNGAPQPPQPAYNPGQPRPSGYDIESPPAPPYANYAPPAGPPPGK